MAITTYGELKTAVNNWLARDDLTNRIPEFIAMAEDRIYSTLRVREMETTANFSLVDGTQSYTLPTRYRQFRMIYLDITNDVRLEFRTPLQFWQIYASQTKAQPQVFTIIGENAYFGPTPDASYTATSFYYQGLAAFSADADTNSLLTKWRGLYLYGALIEAAPFLGDDPRVLMFTQLFEDYVARAQASDARDRHSGDALIQATDVHVV